MLVSLREAFGLDLELDPQLQKKSGKRGVRMLGAVEVAAEILQAWTIVTFSMSGLGGESMLATTS